MAKKYYWEDDKAHGNYDYNFMYTPKGVPGWKVRQLNYLFKFIESKFTLNPKKPLKCLDIGCNAALNLVFFDEHYYNKNNEYVGFDINKKALDFAKENLKEKNATLIKANLVTKDVLSKYDDNHFDFAFSTWALAHMPEKKQKTKLIKDIVRVSKNGIFYEAYDPKKFDCIGKSFIVEDENDNTNVVVYDDYRVYDSVIKLRERTNTELGNSSGLFWWSKS